MAKKKEKFCGLCNCDDHKDMPGSPGNWNCPLIKQKICSVCCHCEFDGGMAAPDTAKEVYQISKTTPQEALKICRACPHGGKDVAVPGQVVYVKPGSEKEVLRMDQSSKRKLEWLEGKRKNP